MRLPRRGKDIETDADAGDMDRRRVIGITSAVRYGVGAPGDDMRLAVAFQRIAEDAEERNHQYSRVMVVAVVSWGSRSARCI